VFVSNAVPVEGHSASVPLSMHPSQVVPYVPVPDTSRQSGQSSAQIASLQHANSYQVAELTESEGPLAAAHSLSSSNDLASVLSLYNSVFRVSCRNSSSSKTRLICDLDLCNTVLQHYGVDRCIA